MKGTVLKIRVNPTNLGLIDEAARVQGITRADFMLNASTEKAQEILLDQIFFNLGDTAFKEFSDLTEAQYAPSENLKKLMSNAPVWSKVPGKFEH